MKAMKAMSKIQSILKDCASTAIHKKAKEKDEV